MVQAAWTASSVQLLCTFFFGHQTNFKSPHCKYAGHEQAVIAHATPPNTAPRMQGGLEPVDMNAVYPQFCGISVLLRGSSCSSERVLALLHLGRLSAQGGLSPVAAVA